MPLPELQSKRTRATAEAAIRSQLTLLQGLDGIVPQSVIENSLNAMFSNFPPAADEFRQALATMFPWWTVPAWTYTPPEG